MSRKVQHQNPGSGRPPRPPRYAALFLGRLSPYDEEYAVRGDLAEEFVERLRTYGRVHAAWWYRRQALFALASYVRLSVRIGVDMLKNIMKVALRNMARYKLYSVINLAGLAAGLTLGLLVLLYVRYEFSYDDFHERPDDIYRVVTKQTGNVYQGTDWWAVSPGYLAEAMKKEYPDAELAARVNRIGVVFRNGAKTFRENRVLFADPDFMRIFRIPVLEGAAAYALREPFTIWLTRNAARKYFGAENPVGQTLSALFRDSRVFSFRIAGIIENAAEPSHLAYDCIASLSSMPEVIGGDYGRQFLTRLSSSLDFTTYVRLLPGTDPAAVESRLPGLAERYENNGQGTRNRFSLQSLRRIHLYSRFNFDISGTNGDIKFVYILSAIGIVILLVACFNFMNLFTARSATRAKEIGVRKVMGSEQKHLRLQFFGEALLFTVLASGAAVLLARLFLPLFNALVGRRIDFSLLSRPGTLLAGGGLVLFVTFVSGAYPAILLSSWSPIPILKGAAQSGGRKTSVLRNALVCFQFTASIALLACTFIINAQMKFVRNKDLGFQRDYIINVLVNEDALVQNQEPFRAEILKDPRILDFTASRVLPSYIGGGSLTKQEDGREIMFYRAYGDYHFLDFYGLSLVMGRNFSPDNPTDEKDAIILNETAARQFGWKDPLGKRVMVDGRSTSVQVIGVVRDFHYHPLNLPMMPLWIRLSPQQNNHFSIKISSFDVPTTLAFLEGVWKKFSPNYPFAYTFMDERIARMYAEQRTFSKMFVALSSLAAFLACLGLVGLAAFTAERRRREIGIRRVLGASAPRVAAVLTQGFLTWVALASVGAFPIAWWAGTSWLRRFAYRITVDWIPFLAALGLALVLAFFSVVVQSFRAAAYDPAETLRHE